MAKGIKPTLFNLIPGGLIAKFSTNRHAYRLFFSLVRGQDVTVPLGAARGLQFNPGQSNPEYAFGNNEIPVQQAIEQQLQKGDTFYDIGSNVGFFTMIAARRVGEEGHVYAFEPLPNNAAVIRHNLALNGFKNTTLFQKAVADYSGTGELFVAHYSGGSALSTVETPPPDLKEKLAVETVAIDNLIEDGSLSRPKMIKIDVEGAELTVLKGMVKTMQQHKPLLLYEIDDSAASEYERKAQECADFLKAFNYQITPLAESYSKIDWHVGHFLAV